MKKLFYILLIGSLLYACGKEEIGIFSVKLVSHSIIEISPTRLFTDGKEVFNAAVINKFTEDYREHFNINQNNTSIAGKYSLIFVSKDSAVFGNSFGCTVHKNGKQFLFYSPLEKYYNSASFEACSRYNILKYTAEKKPSSLPNGYITREVQVGYGSYLSIEMSYLIYKVVVPPYGSHFSMCAAGVLNEFNENIIPSIRSNDTIAVKEYRLRYVME